jgi:hypothetical protein
MQRLYIERWPRGRNRRCAAAAAMPALPAHATPPFARRARRALRIAAGVAGSIDR